MVSMRSSCMRHRLRPRGVKSPVVSTEASPVRTPRWRSGLLMIAMAATIGVISAGVLNGQQSCPCSVWTAATTPGPVANDSGAVELGMKFQSDASGFITGVRFYKYAQNTGTHVGSLWTTGGSNLGTVTFIGESASGWQQAVFPAPIAITA